MAKYKKFLYGFFAIFGLVLFFASTLPVLVGVFHIGVIVPAISGIILSIYCLLSLKYPMENIPWKHEMDEEFIQSMEEARQKEITRPKTYRRSILLGTKSADMENYQSGIENYVPGMIMSREKRVIIDRVVWILVVFSIIVGVGISTLMVNGYNKFEKYQGETVLVLGAKVNGNNPSYPLEKRLDAALEILKKYPEANCIVTGGKGNGEIVEESKVMKTYLVDKGIDENRIFVEDKSVNTKENIVFAGQVAKENNLDERFIIVTENFHQYRANRLARDFDIQTIGYGVQTRRDTVISYWFREMFAILYMLI